MTDLDRRIANELTRLPPDVLTAPFRAVHGQRPLPGSRGTGTTAARGVPAAFGEQAGALPRGGCRGVTEPVVRRVLDTGGMSVAVMPRVVTQRRLRRSAAVWPKVVTHAPLLVAGWAR
jgi:hypothetical protein